MGHHRFKITVDAVIEAPTSVPNGQDPTEQSLAQTIKGRLGNVPVGGTYEIKVENLKVKKQLSN
ncbi:MAG: hypothetical protein ACRDG6_12775 [Candidatus Limnocylindria bacterium]